MIFIMDLLLEPGWHAEFLQVSPLIRPLTNPCQNERLVEVFSSVSWLARSLPPILLMYKFLPTLPSRIGRVWRGQTKAEALIASQCFRVSDTNRCKIIVTEIRPPRSTESQWICIAFQLSVHSQCPMPTEFHSLAQSENN